MKIKFEFCSFRLYIVFLLLAKSFGTILYHPAIKKVDVQDTLISIVFNTDIDTSADICSAIKIFPNIYGDWQWQDTRTLIFKPDEPIPDTNVYILTISPVITGISDTTDDIIDLAFPVRKSISYVVQKLPLQWEDVDRWDAETDWIHGPSVYTLKPKLHPSYQPISSVAFC